MSSISIAGDTSGSVILTVPAAAGSGTITLPSGTGTAAVQGLSTNIVSGTVQNTTSGTSIDFTGIPSWVKRITLSMNGVRSSGTAGYIVQIGAGSVTTSGYLSYYSYLNNAANCGSGTSTAGFSMQSGASTDVHYGHMVLTQLSTNLWVSSHCGGFTNGSLSFSFQGGGSITLGGTLDRIRLTTTNGTDTFAAGTVNIFYE